jgi:Ca2+-binding RTX toxin-like protein
MASFNITGTITTANTLFDVEYGIVGANASVQTANVSAITFAGGNATAIVDGAVTTLNNQAIRSSGAVFPTLVVGPEGTITNASYGNGGTAAVQLNGSGGFYLLNAGAITSSATGIGLGNASNVTGNFENLGDVYGRFSGVYAFVSDARVDIMNAGSIGGDIAIEIEGDIVDAGRVVIENSGTITGGTLAVQAFSLDAIELTNTGLITGTVTLGSGNAVVDTRFGQIQGDIFLGEGDDRFNGSAFGDIVDGGPDNDTLMGNAGNDTLFGDSGFDTLYGNGGDDVLDGGGRADRIVGGKGDDTMTGGGGGDVFVIRRVGNGDDEVTDFQNGSDVVDISALGVQNFNALNNVFGALSQDTDSVIIDLAAAGGSGSIRLMGMTLADMDASDFIF